MIAFAGQAAGATHHIDSAKLAELGRQVSFARDGRIVGIEFHITWDKEVEETVVVVVAPGRAG